MSRIKQVLQHDESDCGPACVSIILQYYGKTIPLRKIRAVAGTDKIGTSGFGISKACETFGLDCEGFMAPQKEKISEIIFPAIFHIKTEIEHYVVVYKIKKNKVYISDPAIGLIKEDLKSFLEKWSGVFFLVSPTSSFEKTNDEQGLLFRFFSLLKPHKKLVISILLASLFLSMFGIFMSFYFRFLIDEVLYSQVKATLNLCSVCYLIIIVFQSVLNFARSQILLYLGEKVDVILLSDFFCHLLHLPMSFFSNRKTGEVLSRVNDAETIRYAIASTTLSVVIDSFMIIVGGFFLFNMGSKLLPISIIPVLISSVIILFFAKPIKILIRQRSIIEADKNASMYESINGIATIKGLATEQIAMDRVEEKICESAHMSVKLRTKGNLQNSILSFVSGCGKLALYWIGSFYIFNGELTLGQLISFITLSGFFLEPLSRVLTMQLQLQEVMIAAQRLSDVIDLEEESDSNLNKDEVESLSGDIEFNNVGFAYGTRGMAIKNISLKIKSGEKVAFVGMSGSGKTTLLKLLMRFYECTEGNILINGKDINEYYIQSYREKIGYVPQESLLFTGTIKENISWGCEIPDIKKIVQCAIDAKAIDFIQNFPDKFDTYVGEHGSTLSGGERQRIALARVLMRDPHFLILDEATASLDSISEHAIMSTIFNRIKNKTVIMVAHRLSTIKNCDKIFVFNKGSLVEEGSHESLLEQKGFYFDLWSTQNEKNICC
ncbi:MAG: peptidase domain-containing ABC transporter [Spirochaetaceae bacterium]|nr:peptidase domain-containing ABC transporter [Spirochaetaceae bacterium]